MARGLPTPPPFRSMSGMETSQLGRLFRTAAGKPVNEELSRTFSADERKKAAKEGASLPDGSYPIYKQEDADNAARLASQGDASADAVLAHIRKRVKALGLKMPPSAAPGADKD